MTNEHYLFLIQKILFVSGQLSTKLYTSILFIIKVILSWKFVDAFKKTYSLVEKNTRWKVFLNSYSKVVWSWKDYFKIYFSFICTKKVKNQIFDSIQLSPSIKYMQKNIHWRLVLPKIGWNQFIILNTKRIKICAAPKGRLKIFKVFQFLHSVGLRLFVRESRKDKKSFRHRTNLNIQKKAQKKHRLWLGKESKFRMKKLRKNWKELTHHKNEKSQFFLK